MHKIGSKNSAGFTLIELLVVISIIGILSSFAIVSLNSARIKARDALRKGDMAQIRTALSLYYDDNLGYPVCDSADWNPSWNPASDPPMGSAPTAGADCYLNTLVADLAAGTEPIMPQAPEDPANKANDPAVSTIYLYRYISNSNGTQYAIIYYLEEDPTTPQIMRGW